MELEHQIKILSQLNEIQAGVISLKRDIKELLDLLEECTGNDAETDGIRHYLLRKHNRG